MQKSHSTVRSAENERSADKEDGTWPRWLARPVNFAKDPKRANPAVSGRLFNRGMVFVYTKAMSDAASPITMHPSSVNLVRSSQSWTEADSAAGFVLRYLSPMRRQLASFLGSNAEADECLKILLAHLVNAGFGEHKRGKLRDFLLKGIRSSARARVAEMPANERPQSNMDSLTSESQQWLEYWRDCLLERAWRALERHEHANPDMPVYSVLFTFKSQPKATTTQLAQQVSKETGNLADEETINRALKLGRTMYAQMIADEVVETLESPTKEDVKSEIVALGMSDAFSGIAL